MKVLLDECLPKKLKLAVEADVVQTVPDAGWAGKQNGELLRLAEMSFDVLLTTDQNIEHQQRITGFNLGLIVLVAPTNDIVDLLPLMLEVNQKLKTIKAGTVEYVK
jgi:hypothetical protein